MKSVTEPYKLSKGLHLFVDWRHVQAGYVQWVSKENKPLSLWGDEEDVGPIDAYPALKDVPKGIRIVAQKAQKSEPFLIRTMPWEHMFFIAHLYMMKGAIGFGMRLSPLSVPMYCVMQSQKMESCGINRP